MKLSRLRIPFVLVVALLGCSRQSEPVDAVAVDPAPKPLARPVAVTRPATREEALAVIDLRKMPETLGAKDRSASEFTLRYSSPASMADAASFHRKKLRDLGWSEDKDPYSSEYAIGERFEKDGFHVWLHVVDLGPRRLDRRDAQELRQHRSAGAPTVRGEIDGRKPCSERMDGHRQGFARGHRRFLPKRTRRRRGGRKGPSNPTPSRKRRATGRFRSRNGVHLLVNSALASARPGSVARRMHRDAERGEGPRSSEIATPRKRREGNGVRTGAAERFDPPARNRSASASPFLSVTLASSAARTNRSTSAESSSRCRGRNADRPSVRTPPTAIATFAAVPPDEEDRGPVSRRCRHIRPRNEPPARAGPDS